MKHLFVVTSLIGFVALLTYYLQHSNRYDIPSPGGEYWATDATPWTTEKWTDDDAPYAAARAKVTQEVDSSRHPLTIVASYKERATNPLTVFIDPTTDSLAVFKWAVAAYEATGSCSSDEEYYQCMAGVLQALDYPDFPNNYEYARMRYLVQLDGYMDIQDLTCLGYRLLRKNYSDPDVLDEVATDEVNLSKALSLISAANRLRPNYGGTFVCLGDIYRDHCNEPGKQIEYGDKAINAYKRYLSMSQPNRDDRLWTINVINEMQQDINQAERAKK